MNWISGGAVKMNPKKSLCKICGEAEGAFYGYCADCEQAKRIVERNIERYPEVERLRDEMHKLYKEFISTGAYAELQHKLNEIIKQESDKLKAITRTEDGKPIFRTGGMKWIGKHKASWRCENCGEKKVWLISSGVSAVSGPFKRYICEVCGFEYERQPKRITAEQRAAMKALGTLNKIAGEVLRGV